MKMDRMMIHCPKITDPDSDFIAQLGDQRSRSREGASVYSQNVKLRHLIRVRAPGTDIDAPFV